VHHDRFFPLIIVNIFVLVVVWSWSYIGSIILNCNLDVFIVFHRIHFRTRSQKVPEDACGFHIFAHMHIDLEYNQQTFLIWMLEFWYDVFCVKLKVVIFVLIPAESSFTEMHR